MNCPREQLAEPKDFESIMSNARLLRPWLATRSDDIEQARQLPADVVDALVDMGAFRLNMPRIWGGPELNSMQQVEVIEELSRGDASVGWCVMIGCDSGIYSGYLENHASRNLYPSLDMVQAGWVYPMGKAEQLDGVYRVSGNWRFCSGSTHADMIAAGCTVYRNGEPVIGANGVPEWRLMLAPTSHWKFDDNWYTTGLKGTASNDYTTYNDYLLIPEHHTFSFRDPQREGALWRKPDTLLRKMAGIPLGTARKLIDEAVELLSEKKEPLTGKSLKNVSRIQNAVADAEMRLGSARSYVFHSLEAQWRQLENYQDFTREVRRDVWLSRLNAFQAARDVARIIYDTVGASAIYTYSGSFDRGIRDTETMGQHMVAQRRGLEDVGALLLDADEQTSSVML